MTKTRQTFPVWADKITEAFEALAKVNRKAARAGLVGYTAEVTAHYTPVQWDGMAGAFRPEDPMVEITVSGETPVLAGWEFLATLTTDAGAVVTRVVPGAEVDLSAFRTRTGECDHCGTVRTRKDTFVVRNVETGEMRQVGSTCVSAFLGGLRISLWAMGIDDEGVWRSIQECGGMRPPSTEMTATVLAAALMMSASRGYVSSALAQATDKVSTARRVLSLLRPVGRLEQDEAARLMPLVAGYAEAAGDVVRWVADTTDLSGEYGANLRAVAGQPVVGLRNVPLLVSAVAAKARSEQVAVERALSPAVGPLLGTEGGKFTAEVTVTGTRWVETQFGSSYMVTARTTDTNSTLKWWASQECLWTGETVTLTGTVKRHGEWNGAPETTVTRCKVNGMMPGKRAAEGPPAALVSA